MTNLKNLGQTFQDVQILVLLFSKRITFSYEKQNNLCIFIGVLDDLMVWALDFISHC